MTKQANNQENKTGNWEKEAQAFMDRLNMFDLDILNSIVYHKLQEQKERYVKMGEDYALQIKKDSRLYKNRDKKERMLEDSLMIEQLFHLIRLEKD